MTLPPAPAPAAERAARIAAAVAASDSETPHLAPDEAGFLEAPLARAPHDLLLYRAENGRVLAELAAAAAAEGRSVEALRAEGETPAMQALLHRLLLAKAKDPAASIHAELARRARQTEPLLIQADGVVVNGNRRLAAMRDLLAADPARYAGFATVTAAVLPARLSAEEIEIVEAALQMAPDLKLDYGWVNRRLKLRRHAQVLPEARRLAAWGLTAERAREELAELDLAEAWLAWIGRPGDHARLAREERRFAGLRAQLDSIGRAPVAEIWRLIGFAMIAEADRLERPVEHDFPFAAASPPTIRLQVPRALAEARGLAARSDPGELRGLEPNVAARLRAELEDPARAGETARAVIALVDALRADDRGLVGFGRAVAHLRRAREAIARTESEAVAPAQRRRLEAEIAALLETVRSLEPRGGAGSAVSGDAGSSGDALARRPVSRLRALLRGSR